MRWTKIAKYLKINYNAEITILTNHKGKKEIKDPLLIEDMKYFDYYFTFKEPFIYGKIKKIRDKIRYKRRINSVANNQNSTIYSNDGERTFKKPTLAHRINTLIDEKYMKAISKKAYRKYKKSIKSVDVVISTYGPIWDHMAAELIKNEDDSIVWLADFRDIYAGNEYETKEEFEKHKLFVSRNLKKASSIIRVAPGIRLFEDSDQNIVDISNGYDPCEKKDAIKCEKFVLLYTGTLYSGTCDLTPVFRAVSELVTENKIDKNDVKIVYAGKSGEVFDHQVDMCGVKDLARNHGVVSRNLVLEMQQKASILLQSSFYSKEFPYIWTGKMFEYMLAAKPIILASVGSEPSEPCRLMHKLGGVGYEPCRHEETYLKMKEYIVEKYNEWKNKGIVSIIRDENYIKSFSYDSIADMIWKLL